MLRALACSLVVLAACTTSSSSTPPTPDAAADVVTHPVACTTPYDCSGSGLQSACCVNHVCVADDGTFCDDMTAQNIVASDYDQSCTTSADCVPAAEGNGCNPGAFDCPMAAINVADEARYMADVAKTHAATCYAPANCPEEFTPCCRAGHCYADLQCQEEAGAPDAGDGGVPDASPEAGTIACGPAHTCDAATEFCWQAGGGVVQPDGGASMSWMCKPIPSQCLAAPTCACIEADGDAGAAPCSCSVQAGGLVVACNYP